MADLHAAEYYSQGDRDYLARLAELAAERSRPRPPVEQRRAVQAAKPQPTDQRRVAAVVDAAAANGQGR